MYHSFLRGLCFTEALFVDYLYKFDYSLDYKREILTEVIAKTVGFFDS